MADVADEVGAEAFHEGREIIAFAGNPLTNILYALFCLVVGSFIVYSALYFVDYRVLDFRSVVTGLSAALGAPALAFTAILSACNAIRGRKTMVAIGAHGLFDWRLSDRWMPWSAILALGVMPGYMGIKYTCYLKLEIDPVFKTSFPFKPLSQALRAVNLGAVTIHLAGVNGNMEQVMQALDRYHPQWR
jgi:hypothetical protein